MWSVCVPSNLNNPHFGDGAYRQHHRGWALWFSFVSCRQYLRIGVFPVFLFRKRWLTLFIMAWALLTCYSRVYLGVHYPGDLLAGTIVGLIGAWLIYRLFVKVSGYKRVEHVTHVYAPIWVGLLTIAGMLVYAGIRTLL